MKKSYIITAVCALLAVLVTVAVVLRDDISSLILGKDNTNVTGDQTEKVDTDTYLSAIKASTDIALPVLKTSLDGVYYTIDTEGTVTFYNIANEALVPVSATGTYDVTVESGDQSLSAGVSYYTDANGKTAGYGLFKPSDNPEVYLYDYAFFYLTDLPDSFAKSDNLLVLVDTDKEDFHKNGKVYEEPFYYNTKTGATSRFLSADNRSIDDTGAPRADYCMITEDVVKDCADEILFFSSRHYHLYDTSNEMDIFMSGGSGNNTDNNRYIQDVVDFYAVNSDDGVIYLGRTETGFAVKIHSDNAETDTVIKEFQGDFATGYLRSGDVIINTTTLETYNIRTHAEATVIQEPVNSFKPETFVVNSDGTYFMRGASNGMAAIALGNILTIGTVYHNDIFKYAVNPVILSDSEVMFSSAKDDAASAYTLNFYTVSASVPTPTE